MRWFCWECGHEGPHKGLGYCLYCDAEENFVDGETMLRFTGEDTIHAGGGAPAVISDKVNYFDYNIGQQVTSKSEQDRIYKDRGLNMQSRAERYRDKEKPNVKGRVVIYPGQKHHKSSVERGGVRTKAGQLVL